MVKSDFLHAFHSLQLTIYLDPDVTFTIDCEFALRFFNSDTIFYTIHISSSLLPIVILSLIESYALDVLQ